MNNSLRRRELLTGAAAAAAMIAATRTDSAIASETTEDGASSRKLTQDKSQVDWPVWDDSEAEVLLSVLNSGKWGRTSGGKKLREFESAFAEAMQAKTCLATSSGTTALLTSMGALGIGPGDEVILPPYTFVATFNAITSSYALPVFVDSHLESFQIDTRKIAAAITTNTKLLMPVHIGGTPADLDALVAIADQHKVPMIEDACQAPLAAWRGRGVGTFGLGGCFSFQASKNLTAGEGGAILSNDEAFAQKCVAFHTPGGAKGVQSLGRGSNYRLTEFQAGLLLAQLERLKVHAKLRDENAAYLNSMLAKIPGIYPATWPEGTTRSGWHLYMFRYAPDENQSVDRAEFIRRLSQAGVSASAGYTSLNRSVHVQALATNPHYLKIYGLERMKAWADQNQCPVNDKLCSQAVWFTQTKLLGTRAEMERIAETIGKVLKI